MDPAQEPDALTDADKRANVIQLVFGGDEER